MFMFDFNLKRRATLNINYLIFNCIQLKGSIVRTLLHTKINNIINFTAYYVVNNACAFPAWMWAVTHHE